MSALTFPDGFLWGVATSSQQIEGAVHEDGRGESIWDRFAATPGRISDGSDASVACDHYHRWRDDIALMQWLGLGAYRFSIAWPRVIPRGTGAVNPAGLDFYDALVDALLERGIQPFLTLYHWDLPQALQDRGGWGDRARPRKPSWNTRRPSPQRLGDRVRHWVTHNEPWCIAHLGHEEGASRPGPHGPAEALRVAHHLLLSHGWASEAIRAKAPGAEVGIVLNLLPRLSRPPAVRSRPRRGPLVRRVLQPLVSRPDLPRAISRRRRRRPHRPRPPARGPRRPSCRTATCGHRRAAGLPGRELLQPHRDAGRPGRHARARPAGSGRGTHRHGMGGLSPGSARLPGARHTATTLRRRSTSPRTAWRIPTPRTGGAASPTLGASTTSARTCWPRTRAIADGVPLAGYFPGR